MAPTFILARLRSGLARFGLAAALSMTAALPMMALAPSAAQAQSAAQRIADHFSSVPSMHGNFVQFDPNGRQSEGKFYIERPGKVRFDYTNTPLRVIADGSTVAINNRKLNTWDTYPLSETPLKLLLDRRIDLSEANIQSVKEEPDLTTIVMGDRSIFGNSRITMMFDPATYDLRQWTVRDAQGKDTTVMIFNVQQGVRFGADTFDIPYRRIHEAKQSSN